MLRFVRSLEKRLPFIIQIRYKAREARSCGQSNTNRGVKAHCGRSCLRWGNLLVDGYQYRWRQLVRAKARFGFSIESEREKCRKATVVLAAAAAPQRWQQQTPGMSISSRQAVAAFASTQTMYHRGGIRTAIAWYGVRRDKSRQQAVFALHSPPPTYYTHISLQRALYDTLHSHSLDQLYTIVCSYCTVPIRLYLLNEWTLWSRGWPIRSTIIVWVTCGRC